MRLKRRTNRPARIEMVPLIDTVFLLLVFFMYAMITMTVHRSVKVDLPEAGRHKPELTRHVTVTINEAGGLFVQGEPITIDSLVATVKTALEESEERKVVIDGDRGASLGIGVKILERLSRIPDIAVSFSVKEEG